jgi:hypothetical protein
LQPLFTSTLYAAEPVPESPAYTYAVVVSSDQRRWGIVTGYSAKDVLRIVSLEGPLIVTRVLDLTGKIDLNKFDQGTCIDEFDRCSINEKFTGKPAVKRPCDTDDTKEFMAAMGKLNPQLIAASAHASEHDWNMGYNAPNMKMDHQDGQLFCIDMDGNRFTMTNNEPKIYIGAGNCLIGNIDQKDCMATSWMHSGGACQFIGYAVSTWFGEMG